MPRFLARTNPNELSLPRAANEGESVFLVAVLDGSDQFVAAHGEERGVCKETAFREICGPRLEAAEGDWLREYDKSFRDAIFARFSGADRGVAAVCAALSIHHQLSVWNFEHQLSWVDQLHARIGIGPERAENAAVALQHSVRGDIQVHASLWQQFDDMQVPLKRLPTEVARSVDQRTWSEIADQLDRGVVLAGDQLHVGRRMGRHIARYAEFRAASGQDQGQAKVV